jgi:vacuolar-type H+-ATPase subunit F/Vma7
MNRIVVLGEATRVSGFALAGATVLEASGAPAVLRAWEILPADTTVLVLTPVAATALRDRLGERRRLLWVEMPR